MASYEQIKYCKKCKRNVSTTKQDPSHCAKCGNVITLGDWTVRFRAMRNGKRINNRLSGYRTKKEAQQGMIDYITKTKEEDNQKTHLLFDIELANYLELDKTQTSPATYYDKVGIFDKYITPYFTGKNISTLKKEDYLKWQDFLWIQKTKAGKLLSHKYKTKIRGHFSAFLTYCESRNNVINYFKQIKLPKRNLEKREMQIIDLQEFYKIIQEIDIDDELNAFKKVELKTIFVCLYFLGTRINELLALSEKDIDIENRLILINKSITRKFSREEYLNTIYLVKRTKNEKIRKIIMPEIVYNQLQEYLNIKRQLNLPDNFLFGGIDPLSEKTITRYKNIYLERASLPYMRLHDFRHSHVSFLIHLGVSFPVIAHRIGDTLDVTVNTYSHLYKNDEKVAIDTLNTYLISNIGS